MKKKKLDNKNLDIFYNRQEDVILHACVERHRREIGDAIKSGDTKMELVYRKHLHAVKKVLRSRYGE